MPAKPNIDREIAEFLKRGGRVSKLPERKAPGFKLGNPCRPS